MKRLITAAVLTTTLAVTVPAFANHPAHCPNGPNGGTTITGTSGDDRCLTGGNGNDTIYGLGGNDRLAGNHGRDVLEGGPGDDRLWGGRSPDTFVCGSGFDVVHNKKGTGNDTIAADCEKVVG